VEVIPEEPEKKTEHTQEDIIQEENTGDVQTATAPVQKTKGRGRKTKQELPEAVETKEAVVIKDVEIEAEPTQDDVKDEEKSGDAPVKARRGRKVNSAVKDDDSQATPVKRARRGEVLPSLQEAAVVETTVPVTKSATRGRGKPKTESKVEDADSKTNVSAGPVRKGRKPAQATPQADPDDAVVVVPSTEDGLEEVEDDLQSTQSKKSVVWKEDLTVTHVISPLARAVRGRKAKPADNVALPRPSPTKRDQSVESVECPASETTASTKPGSKRKAPRNASKAEEEDLSAKAVPSEPIKRARRGKSTDAALVETVTPATEVPETKPRRGRAAKK